MDRFAELQAILCSLPQHAIPSHREAGCFCVSQTRSGKTPSSSPTPADRVEAALSRARLEYPTFAEELKRLSVAHASLDLVCLVDHEKCQLFTSVRGTDNKLRHSTTPRDIGNDAHMLFGLKPPRSSYAADEYRAVRVHFQAYKSFGTGHSLGGNVIESLAVDLEEDKVYVFDRVDVFNIGGSPLMQPSPFKFTQFNEHRVADDIVSAYHPPSPDGNCFVHERKPEFSAHSLHQFLPPKALDIALPTGIDPWWSFWLCGGTRPKSTSLKPIEGPAGGNGLCLGASLRPVPRACPPLIAISGAETTTTNGATAGQRASAVTFADATDSITQDPFLLNPRAASPILGARVPVFAGKAEEVTPCTGTESATSYSEEPAAY